MNAEIISIGTELLMGELTDTNASWIAGRLPRLGIRLQQVSIIDDDLPKLTEAFRRGMERSDVIFTTGGLGPTQDDLTREAVAAALDETPAVQDEELENLRQWFRNRGQDMPAHNVKQAYLIPSAQFITNRNGTAQAGGPKRTASTSSSCRGHRGEPGHVAGRNRRQIEIADRFGSHDHPQHQDVGIG